jgi:hypothetical protein
MTMRKLIRSKFYGHKIILLLSMRSGLCYRKESKLSVTAWESNTAHECYHMVRISCYRFNDASFL